LLGSGISSLAVPLLAVMTLHATAAEMGVLQATGRLPYLALALPAGVWVDRARRRQLLIGTDIVRAVLTLALPIAAFVRILSMPLLWTVALMLSTASMVFELAYRAYLPTLVGRHFVVEANSRLSASRSTTSIVGPVVGGLLVQTLTAPIAILVDALSFVVSSTSLLLIRASEAPLVDSPRRRLSSEVRDGVGYLLGHPTLRVFLLTSGLLNFFLMFPTTLGVLFMIRELHFSPAEIGIVGGIAAPGGVVGALAANRVHKRLDTGRTLLLSQFILLAGLVALPVAAGSTLEEMAILVAGGLATAFGLSVTNIVSYSYRQAVIPDRLQGRVLAANLTMTFGVMPAGSILAGIVGQTVALRPALWIGVGGSAVAFVILAISPLREIREATDRRSE